MEPVLRWRSSTKLKVCSEREGVVLVVAEEVADEVVVEVVAEEVEWENAENAEEVDFFDV
jgi:hypothetical protein